MAGFVGHCAANGIRFLYAACDSIPADIRRRRSGTRPEAGKWQIILTIGFFEFWRENAYVLVGGPVARLRGGKPGYFPTFDQLPHPVPFNLFDPFGHQVGVGGEEGQEPHRRGQQRPPCDDRPDGFPRGVQGPARCRRSASWCRTTATSWRCSTPTSTSSAERNRSSYGGRVDRDTTSQPVWRASSRAAEPPGGKCSHNPGLRTLPRTFLRSLVRSSPSCRLARSPPVAAMVVALDLPFRAAARGARPSRSLRALARRRPRCSATPTGGCHGALPADFELPRGGKSADPFRRRAESCNAWVSLVLDNDLDGSSARSMQSDAGRELLAACGCSADDLSTFVVVDPSFFTRSTALRVASPPPKPAPTPLPPPSPPAPLRDAAYLVAKNRYRLLGRDADGATPSALRAPTKWSGFCVILSPRTPTRRCAGERRAWKAETNERQRSDAERAGGVSEVLARRPRRSI